MSNETKQSIAEYMSKFLRDERIKGRASSAFGYAFLIALFGYFQWNIWILAGIALSDAIMGIALIFWFAYRELPESED